ncbi:glycosyltransferase family 2 protein [Streptomyces sp. NPDC052644]|uniref:glycosyltransferase family 2 protein n=1 Tax=unclassified Streptomyces TaxID=2593676 RepID=UPI00332E2801
MAHTSHGTATDERLRLHIARLSRGNVVRVTPGGPVFGPERPERRVRPTTFVPVLAGRDRALLAALALCWLASFVWFWVWWLQPQHRVGWAGLVVNSLLLLYLTGLPGYFFAATLRLRRVDPALPVPPVPVAFAVTRAPSEPWPTVRATLLAMLAQDYPHPYDVWLCDEDPTGEITRWCGAHHVRISCRRGTADYHRAAWPRRTRCKEGNLAYFYDHWGYLDYTAVAQLDCDHVPAPTYLAEMIRPFADPAIGYVAAPSVCDANGAGSWAARGRLHREAVWHGAVQLGHSGRFAPLCIGSHYAVRTRALREIGGLGPELAEDFSTTFLLNSAGWQGAFAIDAEAHGDGPLTFADMVTQEYQWSRSLMSVLLDLVPRHLRRLPPLLRLRFAYTLGYYPLLGTVVVSGLALPPAAVLTGIPWMDVNYFAFLLHAWSMPVWLLLGLVLVRRRGLTRPRGAPVISWEAWLFALARWPYVVLGVAAAVRLRLRPRSIVFRVTPKDPAGPRVLPARLTAPYCGLALLLCGTALYGELTGPSVGYVFLCLAAGASYAAVALSIPLLHACEAARAAGVRLRETLPATVPAALPAAVLCLPPVALSVAFFPSYAAAVLSR